MIIQTVSFVFVKTETYSTGSQGCILLVCLHICIREPMLFVLKIPGIKTIFWYGTGKRIYTQNHNPS